MLRNLLAVQRISQKTISTASRRQMSNRIAEKQKFFQEDNGLPVHLKGGIKDMLLYRITMLIGVVGIGYVLYDLYKIGGPKDK